MRAQRRAGGPPASGLPEFTELGGRHTEGGEQMAQGHGPQGGPSSGPFSHLSWGRAHSISLLMG